MSNYILLLDKTICPNCHHATVPSHLPGQCRHCGKHLFLATHDFQQFQADTGWREYWVYTGEGWKHSTHINTPNAVALEREYHAPELPSNYGTQEFLNEKIANARKTIPV
jgi:hypothetical protein